MFSFEFVMKPVPEARSVEDGAIAATGTGGEVARETGRERGGGPGPRAVTDMTEGGRALKLLNHR